MGDQITNEDVTVKKQDDSQSSSVLEEEKRKMAEEFNLQRAKMKDLFLQKEDDIKKMQSEKQQLESEVVSLRTEVQQLQTLSDNQMSEIQTLQMLIQETVEASSTSSTEIRKLQKKNLELEQQVNMLNKQAQQDAASVPGALVRTIARKLGADTDLEDKKAQDETEFLRSLVNPLEEEISALKTKLRDTDTQLQQQLAQSSNNVAKGDIKVIDSQDHKCDMCLNYEKQLVAEQTKSTEAMNKTKDLVRALKMATEELEGVRSVHEETIRKWRVERSESQQQLRALTDEASEAKRRLDEAKVSAQSDMAKALDMVTEITVQRETLQEELDALRRQNDLLIGRYTQKAIELQQEDINLPDTVKELQEYLLHVREQQLSSALGHEAAILERSLLKKRLEEHTQAYQQQTVQYASLLNNYQITRDQLTQLESDRLQLNDLGEKLTRANDKIDELLEDKKRLHNDIRELKSRISSLQQELDNSEKVQQDFVRLSQSLQMQLERIREADTEVRWQHEDDITECPSCHLALNNNKQKVHCRHCGRIFCANCVSRRVTSGPRGVSHAVCGVCFTLLKPHAAPYFSTEPPQTP